MPGEKEVNAALKEISWVTLKTHLNVVQALDGEKLVELVRISESMLFKHGGKKLAARDELLSELAAYLRVAGHDDSASALEAYTADLALIEAGFAKILDGIDEGPWKAMSGSVRVGSMLELPSRESRYFNAQMEKALLGESLMAYSMIRAPDGRRIDPDVALDALLDMIKNTVMMEAHRGDMFDTQSHARVPEWPAAEDADVERVADYGNHANSWRNWDGVQQKLRFRGGVLRPLVEDELRLRDRGRRGRWERSLHSVAFHASAGQVRNVKYHRPHVVAKRISSILTRRPRQPRHRPYSRPQRLGRALILTAAQPTRQKCRVAVRPRRPTKSPRWRRLPHRLVRYCWRSLRSPERGRVRYSVALNYNIGT